MLVAWLILALAVVIAAVATSPFWAPAISPLLPWGVSPPSAIREVTAGEVSEMNARIADAQQSLKQITAMQTRLEADEAAIKDQAARISRLEARPTPSETRVEATPTPAPVQSPESAAAIKALQDQIAKLTAGDAATGNRLAALETDIKKAIANNSAMPAMLMALANLRIAVEGSGPFTAELAAVQALARDNTAMKNALASLADDAKTGLPTTAALAERFDRGVAPAILRAPRNDTNADWWQQMRSRVERLVVIRRVGPGGPAPRDTTEAAVTKANAALKIGDLAAAVAALDGLSGDGAKAAASWLAQAKKRVAVEATLAKLWQDQTAKLGSQP